MQRHTLTVEVRETTGTRAARRARERGLIPGVLYGRNSEPLPIAIQLKELRRALAGKAAHTTLLELQGDQKVKGKLALLKDLQHDVVTNAPVHADLLELKLDQKIHVSVPVHLTGKAKGTVEGGIVEHSLREIRIECLPNDIPSAIEVDITELGIGDSLHVREIKLPSGVRAIGDLGAAVVAIVPPQKEVEAVPAAAAAAAGEPEVLTAKAPKAEGGAAPAKEKA